MFVRAIREREIRQALIKTLLKCWGSYNTFQQQLKNLRHGSSRLPSRFSPLNAYHCLETWSCLLMLWSFIFIGNISTLERGAGELFRKSSSPSKITWKGESKEGTKYFPNWQCLSHSWKHPNHKNLCIFLHVQAKIKISVNMCPVCFEQEHKTSDGRKRQRRKC